MRNESAEDFLLLLKEWHKLCQSFSLVGGGDSQLSGDPMIVKDETEDAVDDDDDDDDGLDEEVFEVEKVLSICYGDPKGLKKPGLYLKVFLLWYQAQRPRPLKKSVLKMFSLDIFYIF